VTPSHSDANLDLKSTPSNILTLTAYRLKIPTLILPQQVEKDYANMMSRKAKLKLRNISMSQKRTLINSELLL